MARGTEAKATVQREILNLFPNAFLYNDGKEIRIPMADGAEIVQIKVALTCAKENVEMGADSAMPGDFPAPKTTAPTPQLDAPIAPNAEEKANVAALLKKLGL